METPHVDPEYCVGCGLCEQACLHLPQAIRVVPRTKLTQIRLAKASTPEETSSDRDEPSTKKT